MLRVISTAEVGDEYDAFKLVDLHQKINLPMGHVLEAAAVAIRRRQPGWPAGDSPAVVTRDSQVLVAKLVEGPAPAAIAAVQGQSLDAILRPAFHACEHSHRQVRGQFNGRTD